MTNGEMMQKIFPDMEIEIGEIDAYVWINHEPSHFDKTWWNAEYKEPNYSEIPTGSMDYISKQEVVGLMMHIWGENFSGDDAMQECIDAIRVMPSVTPQEPILDKIREQIKSYLKGVEITLDVLVANDPLRPKMEGAKDTLEECLELIDKAYAEWVAGKE